MRDGQERHEWGNLQGSSLWGTGPGVRNLEEAVFQEEGLARAKGQVEVQNTVLGNGICHGG